MSVIIPIFNKAEYLGACLHSVSSQTLANIQIICIDDASTDGSLNQAEAHARLDDRMLILRNSENLGPGPSRNRGIAAATAPFIQFTDADDILPPGALENLHRLAVGDRVSLVRGSLGCFADQPGSTWQDPLHVMPNRHRIGLLEESKLWVPYFHVCYLVSKEYVWSRQLSYPSLRLGEDPVFLASCLAHVDLLSTTTELTYLYRARPRAFDRPALRALEFIAHVARVRDIYLSSGKARCWTEACDPFYRADVTLLLSRIALSPGEREDVLDALRDIWPDQSLTDALAPPLPPAT